MADPVAAEGSATPPPTANPPTANEPLTAAGRALLDLIYNPESSYTERMVNRAILAIEAEVREQIFRHNGLIADPLAEAAERGTPRSLSDAQQPPAANSETGVATPVEPPPLDYDRLVEAGFLDAYLNINGVEDEAEAERLLREDMAAYSGQPQPALPSYQLEDAVLTALREHDREWGGELHKCRHAKDIASRIADAAAALSPVAQLPSEPPDLPWKSAAMAPSGGSVRLQGSKEDVIWASTRLLDAAELERAGSATQPPESRFRNKWDRLFAADADATALTGDGPPE